MKTIFRISAAVLTASIVFASCTKEKLIDDKATETVAAGTRVIAVSFSNSSVKSELGTNGVTPKFVKDDEIVVSNGSETEVCTVSVTGDVASISPKLTGDLTAVYPASAAKMNGDAIEGVTVPAVQDGTFASANISTATIAADAESALFEHQTAVLRFYVDASIGVKSFTVTSSTADIADGAKTITVDPDGDATLDNVTDDPGKRICYVAVLPTTSATDLTFTSVTTTQTAYPASTVTRTASSVTLVKNRIYDAFVPYYIDLGANGKWAYCNIGAFLPEDYGDYFAWGETVGHKLNADKTATADGHSFDWSTAPFNGGASDYDAAYFTGHISEWLDGNDTDGYTLKLDYDAANANWGDSWRMPTHAEFMALNAITYKEWDSANKGYTFGASPAQIFLPAADRCNGSSFSNLGKNGYYMSSLLYPGAVPNKDVVLYLKNPGGITTGYDCTRSYGQSIRPVYDAPYVPPVPEPLPGLFSVSATKKVQFSPGNLYWDGDSYEFEAHQYDYPTTWDTHHVGHFFWVKNTETSIKPYDASYGSPSPANTSDDIFFSNATANTANAGFTVSGVTGKYRTLSMEEWCYLLCDRTVNGGKMNDHSYSVSITYCGKTGLVIYPDGYSGSPLTVGTDYSVLPEGVVFLPAADYLDGGSFSEPGSGHYWASDAFSGFFAYYKRFSERVDDRGTNYNRNYASSVRLVTDVAAPGPTPDPIEYVDLGLPSGLRWASCNLGATSPEEFGDYFAWGAMEGYKPTGSTFSHNFNWANAPFNNGSSSFNSDYFNSVIGTVCPNDKGILAPEYDAAHVQLGGTWHIPTISDFMELASNTSCSNVYDYEGTGVEGILLTSTVPGHTDQSLFLPFAGIASGTSLIIPMDGLKYWTSQYDYGDLRQQAFAVDYQGGISLSFAARCDGVPIRPVYDPTE